MPPDHETLATHSGSASSRVSDRVGRDDPTFSEALLVDRRKRPASPPPVSRDPFENFQFDAVYLIGCPDAPTHVAETGFCGPYPDPIPAPLAPRPMEPPSTTLAAVVNKVRAPEPLKGGSMERTIVARNVVKSFGSGRDRVQIVRDVSLSVGAGETVFLVGPSGSGKTTLLSILGCILTADEGSVEVLGQDVTRMGREDLSEFRLNHLGYIFQTFNLFPTLSALDNVQLSLAIRGIPRPAARARAAELLDRVGLSHRLRSKPSRLSTGESQRVAIARALAGNPSVLLADEPTASLDAENGQAVMKMLADLARDDGLSLLIVTHDNRIVSFADRILRLEDGRLAGPGGGVVVPHYHPASGTGSKTREALA